MRLQSLFDLIVHHLLQQRAKAVYVEDGRRRAMYVTPDGLKDSIGCLIPANLYDPLIEGYAFKGIATWDQYAPDDGLNRLRKALEAASVDCDDEAVMRFLTDMQHVHDDHEPAFWPDRLRAVARTWRVSPVMVDIQEQSRRMTR